MKLLFQWPQSPLTHCPVNKTRSQCRHRHTVPLRSVSVAWTNKISPDPARTSGPSSFWKNKEEKFRRWMTDGVMVRTKSENGSCGMTQYSFRPLPLPPLPVLHQLLWRRWKSLVCDKSCNPSFRNNSECHHGLQTFPSSTDLAFWKPFLLHCPKPCRVTCGIFTHLSITLHHTGQRRRRRQHRRAGRFLNSSFAIPEIRLQRAATALKGAYLTSDFMSESLTLVCVGLTG